MAEELKEFDAWFGKEYTESRHLGALEGGTDYKKIIKGFGSAPTVVSGLKRMRQFIRLRYVYPMSHEGYTCVVFSATTDSSSTNYAMGFYRDEKTIPEYVCVSPTFESRDGEYRHRFITYAAFQKGYRSLVDELSKMESDLLSLVEENALAIDVRAYPESEKIATAMADERLPLKLMAIAVLLDGWRAQHGLLQIHTNEDYRKLINHIITLRPNLEENSNTIRVKKEATLFENSTTAALAAQCGIKFVPMGIREVMQPTNINFAAWREQYAREAASDLVLNAITPSLPLDNQWSYIEDAGADLYENIAMEEKFDRGGAASESVSHLRKARGALAAKTAEIANAATLGFDAHIRSSIEYAQSFLMMSKITMCATMEHTGFSLASLPKYYARSTVTQPHFVKLLQELPHFAKCAFDLLYGAHCLHTKAGIVQGDLHGNNATLYVFADNYKQHRGEDEKIEFKEVVHNAVVMYVTGLRGAVDSYVFPYTGLVGVVIDFSRSIFGPSMRSKLEEDFGNDFARNFYRDQISRAMRVLNRYAPTFVPDHQEALKAAFLREPEAAFRVLSYVDFLAVGASLAAMLKSYPEKDVLPTDHRKFEPSPHIVAFAERIEKLAREELIVRLHELAGPVGGAPSARREHIPYAGEVLLEKLFADYKFSAKAIRGATLCDAYNHNNPMKWSGRSYEKFPPWARLDEIEKRLGDAKLSDLIGRGPEAFVAALEPETRTEIIAETLRAEQSALDLPTLAATSSWID